MPITHNYQPNTPEQYYAWINSTQPYQINANTYRAMPVDFSDFDNSLWHTEQGLPPVHNPNPWETYFLYGTLQHNHRNNFLLDNENARRISSSSDTYVRKYRLVELYPGVPGIIEFREPSINPESIVYGEIWQIRQPNIELLDAFEQGYVRKKVDVYGTNQPIACYTYVWENELHEISRLSISTWDTITEHLSLEGRL